MNEKNTALERHQVGRFGSVIDFVKDSEKYGDWTCTDDNLMDYLKRVANCDDDAGRKLACDLVGRIESLMKDGEELRKRFNTTSAALEKVNKILKEDLDT